MTTIYLARVKSLHKDAFDETKRDYKPGTWLREYHNTYAGRSFTCSSLAGATLYTDPELDGMLQRENSYDSAYKIEAVKFTIK